MSAAEQAATRAVVADLLGNQPTGKVPATTRANGSTSTGGNPVAGKGQPSMRGQPPSRSGSIPPAGKGSAVAAAGAKQGNRTQSLGPKPNGRALAKPSEEETPQVPKELVTPKVMQATGPNGTSGKAPPLTTVAAPASETVPVPQGKQASVPTDPKKAPVAKVPKRPKKGAAPAPETVSDASAAKTTPEKVSKPVRKGTKKSRTDDAVHVKVISSTVGTPAPKLAKPRRRSRKVSESSSDTSSSDSESEESDTESDTSDSGDNGSDIASVRSTPPRDDAENDANEDADDGNQVAEDADDLPDDAADDADAELDPIRKKLLLSKNVSLKPPRVKSSLASRVVRPGDPQNPYPVLGLKKDFMSDERNWNKLRKAPMPGELKLYNYITGGYHKSAHPSKIAVKKAASPFTDEKLTRYMQEKHGISCFGKFPLIVHGAQALPLETFYLETPLRNGPRGPDA
ncbi:hypothetical protein AAVH_26490 [Aphelenchoides avenae]|nr:hypothetical protein AAVH_26490 [Aphelenchus avenae]